jgi:P pilus assembly chaperone PapD
MRKILTGLGIFVCLFGGLAIPARAEFMIASAIVEFTANGPRQQDIELVSRSKDNDYIEASISEIIHPGEKDETRRVIEDPATAGLLVTPDKTVLAGGGRRVLRFVLLKEPDAEEHIYRVAIKPVIKGLDTSGKVGLKILVGYEVLVIVRPVVPAPQYTAGRQGKTFTIRNTGNTNILFQNGRQCADAGTCVVPPAIRVYAGGTAHAELPYDTPVTYSLWDGAETTEKQFP